jgi:hypothetical protein
MEGTNTVESPFDSPSGRADCSDSHSIRLAVNDCYARCLLADGPTFDLPYLLCQLKKRPHKTDREVWYLRLLEVLRDEGLQSAKEMVSQTVAKLRKDKTDFGLNDKGNWAARTAREVKS